MSGSKTEVKWYKDGKLLTSGKGIHMESKGKIRELVIEKMDKKDAGEYSCEAGTEKLVFKLQLTGMFFEYKSWIDMLLHKALKNIFILRCSSQIPEEACQRHNKCSSK